MSAGTAMRVGRYEIFDELAAGGMATVHLGRMNGAAGFSKTVAIKRLQSFRQDTEFVSSLLEEARLTERIRHNNVVATLDVVSSEQELLLVMEYVHGETLANLLRTCARAGRPCPPEVAAAIAHDVLLGLHAAHDATDATGQRLTIIHRDVSPQNVMVGADGVARLLDFGIAKAMGSATTTREGQVKGKVPYMAPEILRFQPATPQSDVWATGVVLWETLCARRLFRGDSEVDVWGKVLNQPLPRPSEVVAGAAPLDAVVMRALERDTTIRYPSALAMAKDLENAVRIASPTEVAEWVSSHAGSTLAARAAMVRAAEARPAGDASTPPPPAALAPGVLIPAPQEPQLAARAGDVPATSASIRTMAPDAARAKPSRALPITLLLAVLVGVTGVGVWRLRLRMAPEPVVVSAPSSMVASASAPQPSASAAEEPPAPPPAATSVAAPEPSASSTKTSGARPPATGPKPRPPKTSSSSTSAGTATATSRKPDPCDPPYSIGPDGKKHFKLECVAEQ